MIRPGSSDLKVACETLAACDRALERAYSECGVPIWRARPISFETLAELVTYQLISTRAAGAIWSRVRACFVGDVTASACLALPEEALRQAGQSRPKIAHMRSIATAIETRALDLASLAQGTAETARVQLLAVKGIGPWTAELVLLYGRAEMDAFPTGDVGLMESYKRLSGADERLSARDFSELAERWRPYRGVAAHLLWTWLNAERKGEKPAANG